MCLFNHEFPESQFLTSSFEKAVRIQILITGNVYRQAARIFSATNYDLLKPKNDLEFKFLKIP